MNRCIKFFYLLWYSYSLHAHLDSKAEIELSFFVIGPLAGPFFCFYCHFFITVFYKNLNKNKYIFVPILKEMLSCLFYIEDLRVSIHIAHVPTASYSISLATLPHLESSWIECITGGRRERNMAACWLVFDIEVMMLFIGLIINYNLYI